MANQTKITAEPGKQEIIIEREFDAPRDLVFKVTTDPKYLPQWWGRMKGHTTTVDKADVRSGGEWRYIHTDDRGQSIGFHGVYHEILKPSRVIQTFEWEGLPETGHVILETTKFEELPKDRTKITIQQVFQSVNDRDGMVQSGQEGGLKASHEYLEELLATLKDTKQV
ncbi:MAG TPA: SRPBCC family protein [Candidatus Acidoferrales bacterium]|nr:SRPBCC family protein [Candidatus Acidoferrales bacterium]